MLLMLVGSAGAGQPVNIGTTNFARITVLVDNHPFDGLKSPWGLSIAVNSGDRNFMFDTGPSPDALLYDAERLKIKLGNVSFVVISHQHQDHTGGLPAIVKKAGGIPVYMPSKASTNTIDWVKKLGFDVITVSNSRKICEGVGIVGELYGPPYEEALVINVKDKGLILLVGCSHPGVDKIVYKAKSVFGRPVYAVIGGFHLLNKSRKRVKAVIENILKAGVQKVAPLHCSGDFARSFVREEYPEHCLDMHVGSVLEVGDKDGEE